MDFFNLFSLFGGLALFLFGMDIMGKALEKQAGGKLQKILSKLTDNPFKGFMLGLAVTAVIQSSSATTVMVVGFVNSGIMQLHQAVGIIMGSNVGTTVTSWILSLSGIEGNSFWVKLFKPTSFSPILAFIGIVLYMFCRSEKKKGSGTILLGFAVLMTGMTAMSSAVAPLSDAPWFRDLFVQFTNPILGVLAGAVLTAVIQSSSASVGILQALSSTGVITYGSAIPIIMGQNIGTCVTALISSVGANKNARRAAMIHLYFNIIGVLVFLSIFYTANTFIHFPILEENVSTFGIAIVHTLFNVLATLVMLPFSRLLEKLAYLTIPQDDAPEQFQMLDPRLLATPAVAADRASVTTADMAELARASFLGAIALTHRWNEEGAERVRRQENETDKYEDAIGTYLVKLSTCNLTLKDSHLVNTLLHTISDFERISDHATNLLGTAREIEEKNIVFSAQAQSELIVLEDAVQEIINRTVDCFENNDLVAASRVEPLEQVIDDLVRKIKSRHIARLQTGSCTIEYGFVLDDLLTNYERVADHCSNIAVAMIQVADDSFETHEYLTSVKSGGNENFDQMFREFRGKFRFPDESL
ncbi:Na/Pi cotransporter family protein [Pygmaiobacter massiliensis]|uniref:Na/Pi cotransporter family protein n=1 Tax=Pygmaiobacter massiliensis TaxID=1917873 RepID=UPI002A80DD9A|nr:Na/Pi cotransporter family protein [Pygmaiobacter massiliensis]MDY4785601.1 Na/Pi cotransporter family protein [Pygmaiobacter massiliensis]